MGPLIESLQSVPFRGEILSVGSALVWSAAVLLFRVSGRTVSPLALNLFKNSFATVILVVVMGLLGRPLLPDAPLLDYALIGLSGLIGVAISDTLFFGCLNLLGASLTAVVDCLYSPFVILFSFLFIGERLGARQILGVALILSALVWISRSKEKNLPPRKALVRGIGLGALAMITLAASIVMIKPLLAGTSVLWATLWRMAVGTVALGAALPFHPRSRVISRPLLSPRNWRPMVPGAFLGAFVSPVVWMAGMKYTLVSIAAPLNQLNSIFIFVLAAIFLKEKVTRAKIAAVVLATAGAFLVSWP
ncbi:MAG: DMT family transporter [Candidatus Aminicenantes bacterium]|nr:DMT family transporter [Candidatus Aminicenantes bacterium]